MAAVLTHGGADLISAAAPCRRICSSSMFLDVLRVENFNLQPTYPTVDPNRRRLFIEHQGWQRLADDGSSGASDAPALTSLQAAAGLGPGGSLLDIRVAGDDLGRGHSHRISSLLDAAAPLSPVEFHFALPRDMLVTDVELLRFDLDLADFVLRCPRLRVLRVANDCYHSAGDITIKSESLEELQVRSRSKWTRCIDVEAPMLKQLTVAFHTINELRVSIVAPTVKKVSLECYYTIETEEISCWGLSMMTLHTGTAETEGQRLLTETGTEDDARLPLSNVYVLSLHLSGSPGWTAKPDAELEVAQKIEALLVTGFSVLELHFSTTEFHFGIPAKHAFGACVVVKECPVNCRCDKPKNWRRKNISLINLEEVEIKGFEGEDHDFDFLKVIFRCAPMLKRMSMWMCDEGQSTTAKVVHWNDSHLCVYGLAAVLIDKMVLSHEDQLRNPVSEFC
ncbi:hypothetical protein TRIUR3_04504 [Triticum urartu]|uniref:FBD domain-containing protein n=1 Tax=Triticum urartu TaxID=4572 RepID=M7ZW78_TRIUA|nr:hypothetical protein TRIUR3_04504 [Triticum urartu]